MAAHSHPPKVGATPAPEAAEACAEGLPDPYTDEHHHDHGSAFLHDPRRVGRLKLAFLLTSITMVAELIGGVVSGSLALLADAGHMLVDAAALLFAWMGASLARRPADARRSYGYARLEVLVGYTNALLQVFLVLWISFEAVGRLFDPQPILSGTMLAVAVLGLVVNLLVLWVLGHHDHEDVNAAGAYLHVLGDLLGSIAAISAALAVRYFGWLWTDPVVSLVVAVLILVAAVRLLRRAGHILLEGVPEGIDVNAVARELEQRVPAVRDVHHVHIWQLTGGSRVATLHAVLSPGHDADSAIQAVRDALHQQFSISHVTVQLDGVVCANLDCDTPPSEAAATDDCHGHH